MSDWKKVKIGDFLTESKIIAEYSDAEHRITVRLNCKGIEKRDLKVEKEGATKYFIRKAGQFIYGKQNIHKGAFGIIPQELDGYTSSADLPSFDFDLSKCNPEWLCLCLKVDERYKKLQKNVKGVGSQRLAVNDFLKQEILLPDLSTQKEIVKVLSKKIEKVELIKSEIESQKSYVKLLRQNILQEAIEGKLTEEWRKENPVVKGNPDFDAEALFEKIQEEKCLTDSELLRNSKKKVFEPISENEQPFEIPEGWKWVRLGEICDIIGGYAFNSYDLKPTGDNYVLRLGNIRNNQIRYEAKPAFISNKITENLDIYKAKLNDIFLTMTGTRGKQDYLYSVLVSKEHLEKYQMFVNQRVCIIRSIFYPGYVYKTLHSDVLKKPIFESATGSANQANVGIKAINDWVIPFPPLAEQKEIVSRVEKLLANVTELEKQITEREEMTKQLIQSIMKDAFREE